MIAALIGLLVAAFVGFIVLTVVLAVFGAIFGVAFGLLGAAVKILPLLLVGWVVVKLVQRAERPRQTLPTLSTSDSKWLDT